MSNMQSAYKKGTKVFVLRDFTRCWTIPVQALTNTEQALISQQLASCTAK
jgi:hypothetical protein